MAFGPRCFFGFSFTLFFQWWRIVTCSKLQIYGHVHGAPERLISSYYSFPKGITLREAFVLVDRFMKAFDNVRFRYET